MREIGNITVNWQITDEWQHVLPWDITLKGTNKTLNSYVLIWQHKEVSTLIRLMTATFKMLPFYLWRRYIPTNTHQEISEESLWQHSKCYHFIHKEGTFLPIYIKKFQKNPYGKTWISWRHFFFVFLLWFAPPKPHTLFGLATKSLVPSPYVFSRSKHLKVLSYIKMSELGPLSILIMKAWWPMNRQ